MPCTPPHPYAIICLYNSTDGITHPIMPNKLFISYPSESWNFAQRLANDLTEQINDDIFIDYRSIDNADFEKAIP
jgi:hypothetical protein